MPLRSVCACLQHYLSFSLQMSLSPLDLSIHHEKPVIKIKRFVHYRCNITVLNLTVLYYFCVTTCSPKLSQLYKRDVTMFFSSVGYEKCCILKTHKISKTFCSLYTVLQSVYCTISKLLNKYKIYIILYNFPKMWYKLVGF